MPLPSKTLVMQRLQDAARFGYYYYTTGTLDDSVKMHRLQRKFALVYDTELSRFAKCRRRRSGEATTALYILERDYTTPRYWFVLMATEGIGRVHTYEKLQDLRRDRLTLDGYELVHDGRCWSWRMARETVRYWRERIHTVAALHPERRRVDQDARGIFDVDAEKILASLYAVPGFRLARRQVGELVTFMRGEWQRLRPDGRIDPRWRTFLGYVRRLPNAARAAHVVRQCREGDGATPAMIPPAAAPGSEEARVG